MAKGKRTTAPSKQAKKRPEAREKQRILMAERRAAVKARRRQWDPPKKIKSVVHDTNAPNTPVLPPQDRPEPDGDASITSAEHVAIHMLLEMADATGPGTPPPGSDSEPATQDFVADDPMLPSASASSRHSSLEAVKKHPVRQHADATFTSQPLPPNVSPPTKLQKKVYRELGVLGPLTYIQRVQIHVATLADSGSSINDVDDDEIPEGPSFLTMSTQRWERIWAWREGVQTE
ncbi:hypothetical protein B0H16DRAFT_1467798 [Mycena metata]|uniref:Uncharacterized protein n=1 Tax=Mycena metata TaxID=1033252 RepID=A0AAD7I4G8_9AGAR|nr:hypothetical protein B0H16DRAFT_1467798 [Mycena metata]